MANGRCIQPRNLNLPKTWSSQICVILTQSVTLALPRSAKSRHRVQPIHEWNLKVESGMIRALRTLRNEPGFAFSAVLTLALGIACSSAMFSVFYAVLLAPVPYADPLRVMAIHTRSNTTGRQTIRLSGGDWSDLAASGIFETLGRYHGGEVGVQLRNRAEWARVVLGVAHLLPGLRCGAGT